MSQNLKDAVKGKKPDRCLVEPDRDENGKVYISERYLKELCEANGQYETPALNNTLYLHYKGFSKIENLEGYENLTSLWLECNGLLKIEGLDHHYSLKMLFLHQNLLTKIENIQHLHNLVTINLSNNQIKVIENLKGMDSL